MIKHNTIRAAAVSFLAIAVSLLSSGIASAAITTPLSLGSSGSQVRELQQFLATDPAIYPAGLVTGYFGQLTQAAVQRFQAAQGIVSSGSPSTTGYGRVGPMTMARINALAVAGGGGDSAPWLSNPTVQVTGTSATLNWTSNEATTGQVYYATVPLQFEEATGPHQLPYVSGTLAPLADGYQMSHIVTISGLTPNTTYYFLTRGVDSSGNMSMVWPTTFRTTN